MADEAMDRAENARDWAEEKWNSPLGKVLRKGAEDILKDVAEGKKKGKVGWTVEAGKLLGLYGLYKGQELAGKLWERKADILTGAAAGAALRVLYVSAGFEVYLANAVAAGSIAGLRRGWSELENYDKPEGIKARANIIGRIRKLDADQRQGLAMKMATAAGLGFGGSLLGISFMEYTGLGDSLHHALRLDKTPEAVSGIRDNLPRVSGGVPGISESTEAVSPPATPDGGISNSTPPGEISSTGGKPGAELPGKSAPELPGVAPSIADSGSSGVGAELDPSMQPPDLEGVRPPGNPYGPGQTIPDSSEAPTPPQPTLPARPSIVTLPGTSDSGPPSVTTASGPPYGAEAEVGVSQGTPPASVPEAQPPQSAPPAETRPAVPPAEVSLNPIDKAVESLPERLPSPPDGGWGASKDLLNMIKAQNPDLKFNDLDIMDLDKALCRSSDVNVPEWGIKGSYDSRVLVNLQDKGDFKGFVVDDNVKDTIKLITARAAARP